MENKKCANCESVNFTEATDYMPVKPNKMSFQGTNRIYTFCLNCGEVHSIRMEDTSIFKK